MLKKLFLSLVLCVVVGLIQTSKVSAQATNAYANNSSLPNCSITINNITAIPSDPGLTLNQVPLTVPSRYRNGVKFYEFNIVLSPEAKQRYQSCSPNQSVPLTAAITSQFAFTNLSDWVRDDIDVISTDPASFFASFWGLDGDEPDNFSFLRVETKEPCFLNGQSNYPICKEYVVRLNGNALQQTAQCTSSIADFSATIPDQLPSQVQALEPITITNNFMTEYARCSGSKIEFEIYYLGNESTETYTLEVQSGILDSPTSDSFTFTPKFVGQYTLTARFLGNGEAWGVPELPFTGQTGGGTEEIATAFIHPFCATTAGETCVPPSGNLGDIKPNPYVMCNQIPEGSSARQECCKCATGTSSCDLTTEVKGVWTAVGCINTDATSIISSLMKIGLGLAGGVTVLMILAAGFMFSTSQGEPKRAGEAKDLITSAVVGLLFIIFSVTMLRFIGVDVLQIPGFGTPTP